MTREKVQDIVRGHEIWLEHDKLHAHPGDMVECKLFLGHNMVVDGMPDLKNVKAALFDPEGQKQDLAVDAGDDCLIMRFDPVLDGYHSVAVEYDAGIYSVTDDGGHVGPKSDYENVKSSGYYCQYARLIVSVGHGGPKELNLIPGHELEIIPVDFRHYHAGEAIELQVMYDGAALAGAVIDAASGGDGSDAASETTDSDGIASIKLDKSGNWMFKVRHTDPDKGVENRYDEKMITAVLSVMGVH
ncbi:MAG: DUF4198 domain-containing protein [Methanosarcinales archaeon]|nr:MAG: DUF4198 domain-containing protein [Methanosarcinales archaeon]